MKNKLGVETLIGIFTASDGDLKILLNRKKDEPYKGYWTLLGYKLDRRNFRKKFMMMDLIEDTGYKNEGFNGRPAKLYSFKDNIKEKELF